MINSHLRARRVALLLVLSAVLSLAVVSGVSHGAPGAGVDECDPATDPYGCIDTTLPGETPPPPACVTSVSSGRPGDRVAVTITNVPGGSAVSLRFNGTPVASATAPASDTPVDVPMTFTVPEIAAGRYSLVAVGPGFSAECLAGTGFEVLSSGTPRSGGGGGGGSLARTGFTVLGLLVLAAVLVLVGRVMVQSSRRHERI